MFERFRFGRVALLAPLPAYVFGSLDHGDAGDSADAAPTTRRWAAMFLRFFLGREALAPSLLATGDGGQPNIALVAAPALRRRTMPERLVFGTIAGRIV